MTVEESLKRRLARVEVPLSRLTTATLIETGRRAKRRGTVVRVLCGAALVTGMLAGVPVLLRSQNQPHQTAAASLSGRCTEKDLAEPPGRHNVSANVIDPTGKYVVGVSPDENHTKFATFKPVLWTGTSPQLLPIGGRTARPTAVNAKGTVVGLVGNPGAIAVWRYVDGKVEKFTTPNGSADSPSRQRVDQTADPGPQVNAAGDVVASVSGQVYSWAAGSTVAKQLPLPHGFEVHGFTDDGTILGDIGNTARSWRADLGLQPLDTPYGPLATVVAARGDWVFGRLSYAGTAVRWNRRTHAAAKLELPVTNYGAINARGWVVMEETIVRDRGPEPLAQNSHGSILGVSDTGKAVGMKYVAHDRTSSTVPVIWDCRG